MLTRKTVNTGKIRKLPHKKTSSFSILHFTHRSIAFDNDIQQFMRFTKQPKNMFSLIFGPGSGSVGTSSGQNKLDPRHHHRRVVVLISHLFKKKPSCSSWSIKSLIDLRATSGKF